MKRLLTRSSELSALLALALAAFFVGTMFADESDDDKKKNNGGESVGDCRGGNNCVDQPSGSADTTKTSGEIIAINTLVEPNEIILANLDGRVTVKLYGKDAPFLIKQSGVKVRDYVEMSGYKENEHLFWADTISEPDDNSN